MQNPALAYLAVDLMHLEHREQRWQRKLERKQWRQTHDPFDMDEDIFINLFRLSPDLTPELIEEIGPELERQRPYGISVEHQVLAALRFYAKGCDQDAIGEQWDIALSQPSISRCIRSVTELINRRLVRRWVKFPMTAEEKYGAQEKFMDCAQPFPGTIGAVDCRYIHIKAPNYHEEAYVNHWGDHTLNVQVICDPDLRALNVNARYPGARNDYFIWNNSAVRQTMERWYNRGERGTWIIGDDGYFIEPWLMTPLKHEQVDTPRYRYNDALCKSRSIIERFFGVLKAEFRCVSAQRVLMYDPVMAGKIVNVCAALHNMRIEHRLEPINPDANDVQQHHEANLERNGNLGDDVQLTVRALGHRIQDRLIAQHFT